MTDSFHTRAGDNASNQPQHSSGDADFLEESRDGFAKRHWKKLVAGGSLLAVAALGATAYALAPRPITDIEESVPRSVSALFVTDYNTSSWDYIHSMSGLADIPDPTKADNIALALIGNDPILYIEGEWSGDEKALAEQGILVNRKDDIISFAAKKDEAAIQPVTFADEGKALADAESYKETAQEGSRVSYGFINFQNIAPMDNEDYLGKVFPSAGIWSGGYKDGKWTGTVSDVDTSKRVTEGLEALSLPSDTLNIFYTGSKFEGEGNKLEGYFKVSLYNAVANTVYPTTMDRVQFKLDGNHLEFDLLMEGQNTEGNEENNE